MKYRIHQLDFLRFIMIILIMISHLDFISEIDKFNIYSSYINNPTLPVDYFFMLSGFGIFISLSYKAELDNNLLLFSVKKVKKIYPYYVFCLLIMIPLVIIKRVEVYPFSKALLLTIINMIVDLLLLQSTTGISSFSRSLNSVSWFLSCLFIIYIFSIIFFKIINKLKTKKSLIFSFLIVSLVNLIIIYLLNIIEENISIGDRIFFDDLVYGSPYSRVFLFIIGMILARLLIVIDFGSKIKKEYKNFTQFFIVFCAIFWYIFENSCGYHFLLKRFLDICICSSIVFSFSLKGSIIDDKISNNLFLIKASQLTMFLFLVHYPVIMYLDYFVLCFFNEHNVIIVIIEIIVFFVLTFLFSYILFFIKKHKKKEIINE